MGSSVILPPPGQPAIGPDTSFKSATRPNLVSFGLERIDPPSPLYIQRDDVLVLFAVSSVAGETVTLTARLLVAAPDYAGQPDAPSSVNAAEPGPLATQTVKTIQQTITLTAVDSLQTLVIPLAEGYLLSVDVIAGTTFVRGATFARVFLSRGTAPSVFLNQVLTLVADYCTVRHPIGWPYGRVVFPTEGPGNLKTISPANPAAGTDFTITVLANERWRISSFAATLAIANAGAARIIRVQVKTAVGNLVWQAAAQQTGAINTTVTVACGPGQVTSVVDTTTLNLPLPGTAFLGSGDTIGVSTSNINVADQWSAIQMQVESWEDRL